MARLSSDHDWLQSCGSGKSELDVVGQHPPRRSAPQQEKQQQQPATGWQLSRKKSSTVAEEQAESKQRHPTPACKAAHA
jgi:hypothetical protein